MPFVYLLQTSGVIYNLMPYNVYKIGYTTHSNIYKYIKTRYRGIHQPKMGQFYYLEYDTQKEAYEAEQNCKRMLTGTYQCIKNTKEFFKSVEDISCIVHYSLHKYSFKCNYGVLEDKSSCMKRVNRFYKQWEDNKQWYRKNYTPKKKVDIDDIKQLEEQCEQEIEKFGYVDVTRFSFYKMRL